MREIIVRTETDQVDITCGGFFEGGPPADPARVFMPGLTTYYVTVDGEELPPMTPEQFEDWRVANKEESGGLL